MFESAFAPTQPREMSADTPQLRDQLRPFHPTYPHAADVRGSARWLSTTDALQAGHPRIRILAQRLTQLEGSDRQKAVACVEYVRSIFFAWVRGAGSRRDALQVLRKGSGDSFGKGTLLVSLLRSIDIPARLRVVALPGEIFHGLLNDTGGLVVNHAFVEIMLDQQWLATDAHVLDDEFVRGARAALQRTACTRGFGLVDSGQSHWHGRGPAFCQFDPWRPGHGALGEWGWFHDATSFLDYHGETQVQGGMSARLQHELDLALVNRRAAALRQQSCATQASA